MTKKKERFRAHVAVYLVLIKDDKILLLRRFNTNYHNGDYSLVSGHLDGGETVMNGMIREAKEEAGIELTQEDLSVAHIAHRGGEKREYIDLYIQAERWTGEIKNMEPEKCDDLSWFDINILPDNMVPEVRVAIESIIKKEVYSEYNW